MKRSIWMAAVAALLAACIHEQPGVKSKAPVSAEAQAAAAATAAKEAAAKEAAAKEAAAKELAAKEAAAKEAAAKAEAAAKEAARLVATISITSTSPEAVEAFKLGFEWGFSGHTDRALEQWRKAVALDANFLLAKAYLYSYLAGVESMQQVSAAVAAGAGLPEAERTELQMIDAYKHGDGTKGSELAARLVWLAPADWRAQLSAFLPAISARKLDEAAASCHRAIELNPKSFAVWAAQGQVAFLKGDHDAEVAARGKALAARPDEPALQDDLAQSLLGAGKVAEAAAAANVETKMPGAGWEAHATLSAILCLRGDWAGGIKEMDLARAQAKDPNQAFTLRESVALLHLAGKKNANALKTLATLEAETKGKNPNIYVLAAIDRALVELDQGKHAAAIKAADEALARVTSEQLSGAGRTFLNRAALLMSARAHAAAGKADAAQAAAAALQAAIGAEAAADQDLVSMIAFAQGEAALAKKDAAGAVAQLSKCVAEDHPCRQALAAAQEKAGDKAAAAATRKAILAGMHTDPVGLLVRSRIAAAAKKK